MVATAAESLTDVLEEMHERQDRLNTIFQQAGPTLDMTLVSSIRGSSEEKLAQVQQIEGELKDLGQKHDRLKLAETVLQNNQREVMRRSHPVNSPPFGDVDGEMPEITSRAQLHKLIVESKAYEAFRAGRQKSATIEIPVPEFKTLITLTTVNAQATRGPLVNMALEQRTVADLMLQGQTSANTIEYYEETTFTNAADTRAEGVAKPESALAYTLRTDNVRKIAHWIPATTEALEDVPFLESQMRGRLAFGVQRKEEQQLLAGDGTAPNISGILDRTDIQTQAKGADPTPDAIYKAMQKIRGADGLGFAEPTAVVIHPNDFTAIRLLRTADGLYIFGNPQDADGVDRIWGLEVRQTTAMTENTALVGDFRQAEVFRRSGISITVSTEHASYAIENKVAIIAESRLALAVYRPSAFATVTGI